MKRIDHLIKLISIPLICLFLSGCSTESPKKEFKLSPGTLPDTFLMGSHLCRVPMPQTEAESKYEFERYDTIIKHAKDLGMYVYMGFTIEQAPPW